jgi:hypothetical protein
LVPGPSLTPVPPLNPGPALTAGAGAPIPFKNGSFEQPVVTKRLSNMEGGNPATTAETDWGHLTRGKGKGEGALLVGLTNEIARTGKQSFYVDFAGITGKQFSGALMTQMVPVKAEQVYKVGMWGRTDKERPLTLDQRRPYLRMEFEYYQQDEATQVKDTDNRVTLIPGSMKRLLFTSSQWSQAYGVVRTPKDAALMKVTFVFNVPNGPGKTDGVLFFDDAFIQELPNTFPVSASDEILVEEAEQEEPAPDSANAAPSAPAEGSPKPPVQDPPK